MREIIYPLMCDTCKQAINDVSEAMVEWINEDSIRDVRIIHCKIISLNNPEKTRNCYQHSSNPKFADAHLQNVLDDHELMQKLGLVRHIRVFDVSDL